MQATAQQAFAEVYERLAPGPSDLVNEGVHAEVFEAFRDVKAAVHPELVADISGRDYVGRGLMAHALFLAWNDRREGEFLLEQVRDHMMSQLRDEKTPLAHIYRLCEALTRFCDSWRAVDEQE